jgi:hypothetical protein
MMELLHADEYIACIQAGKKPALAVAGSLIVTNGFLTGSGKYLLEIGGEIYEVKPDFNLSVQWAEDELSGSQSP